MCYVYLKFLRASAEVIYTIPAGKSYPGVVLDFNSLLSNSLPRYRFKAYKWMEIKLYATARRERKVRRLIAFRPWLGNQNLFHLHGWGVSLPVFYHTGSLKLAAKLISSFKI